MSTMHYHVYTESKTSLTSPKVFNFEDSKSAIDKVLDLIKDFNSEELVDVVDSENILGRFSVMTIKSIGIQIVLQECSCDNNSNKNKSMLN